MKQLSVRRKEQYVSQTSHQPARCRAVPVVVGLFQMCTSPPQGIFVRWLKLNFSEVFIAWIHLKALRVFVESALRSALTSLIITVFFSVIIIKSKQHMTHVHVIAMYGDVTVSPARYGLPLNYQALLLQTDGKHSKKLGEELSSLFMHLDPTATTSKADVRGRVYTVFHLKPQGKRHKHAACGAWVILKLGLREHKWINFHWLPWASVSKWNKELSWPMCDTSFTPEWVPIKQMVNLKAGNVCTAVCQWAALGGEQLTSQTNTLPFDYSCFTRLPFCIPFQCCLPEAHI